MANSVADPFSFVSPFFKKALPLTEQDTLNNY